MSLRVTSFLGGFSKLHPAIRSPPQVGQLAAKERMARVFQRNGIYYLDYFDEFGVRQRPSSGLRKKKDAEYALAKAVNDVRLRRAGLLNSKSNLRNQPISQHLADFQAFLEAKSTLASSKREVIEVVQDYLSSQNIRHLEQMTQTSGIAWLNKLKRRRIKDKRTGEPKNYSGRSVNKRRGHLVAFGRWLEDEDRIDKSPFRRLPKQQETNQGVEDKPRHLTIEQFAELIKVSPPYYQLVWLFAAVTGFRRSEIKRTKLSHLTGNLLVVSGGETKNKKNEIMELPEEFARELRRLADSTYRDGLMKQAKAWNRGGTDRSGFLFPSVPNPRTFQRYREKAGIPYKTAMGIATLHSLRKTLGKALQKTGTEIGVAKNVMRHSDVRLTVGTYQQTELTEKKEAVEKVWKVISNVAQYMAQKE